MFLDLYTTVSVSFLCVHLHMQSVDHKDPSRRKKKRAIGDLAADEAHDGSWFAQLSLESCLYLSCIDC